MTEKNQTTELTQATERFAAAVEEFARSVERLRPAPLSEEEAGRIAYEAIHEWRMKNLGDGGFERGPITDEEAEEWTRRREERRRREGYRPI